MTRKSFFTTALSLLGFAALAPRAKAEYGEPAPAGSAPNTNPTTRNPQPEPAEVPMELRSPQRGWHIAPSPENFSAVIAWVASVAASVGDGELSLDEAIAGVFGFGHTHSKALEDALSNADEGTKTEFRIGHSAVLHLMSTLEQMTEHISGMADVQRRYHGRNRAIANGLCEALRMGMIADPFYPDFLPELGIKPSIVAGVPLGAPLGAPLA